VCRGYAPSSDLVAADALHLPRARKCDKIIPLRLVGQRKGTGEMLGSEAANRIKRGADGAPHRWDGCAVLCLRLSVATGGVEPVKTNCIVLPGIT
jgi:hypothetical protein